MQAHANDLIAIGHHVLSRWVFTDNDKLDADLRRTNLLPSEKAVAARLAWENIQQIAEADVFIAFTESNRFAEEQEISEVRDGGRHVEFGVAIGVRAHAPNFGKMRIMFVGPPENLFMHFDWIEQFHAWPEVLMEIGAAPLVARQ